MKNLKQLLCVIFLSLFFVFVTFAANEDSASPIQIKRGCEGSRIDGYEVRDLDDGESRRVEKEVDGIRFIQNFKCDDGNIHKDGEEEIRGCRGEIIDGYNIGRLGEGKTFLAKKEITGIKYEQRFKCEKGILRKDGVEKVMEPPLPMGIEDISKEVSLIKGNTYSAVYTTHIGVPVIKCKDYVDRKVTTIELTVNGHKRSIPCDLEAPGFVASVDVPSSKKASENNITIIGHLFDDASYMADTTTLYGDNFPIEYEITFDGPYKTIDGNTYGGNLSVSAGSAKIEESGKINNTGILEKTYSLTNAGLYKYTLVLVDKSKLKSRTTTISKIVTIYPDGLSGTKSILTPLTNVEKFANNSDYYEYTLQLKDNYDNYVFEKKVNEIKQTCLGITGGCDEIMLNMVDKSGGDGTFAFDYNSKVTDSDGKINFKLKSYTPGLFSEYFGVELNDWLDTYQPTSDIIIGDVGNISNKKIFAEPVSIGNIETSNDNGKKWDAMVDIGKDQKYRISLLNIGGLNTSGNTNINSGLVDINSNTIVNTIDGHFWVTFGKETKAFGNNINIKTLGFTGKIDIKGNALSQPSITAKNLPISYTLGGKSGISYYLGDFIKEGICENKSTLGVKVLGILQSEGKGSQTGQEENFSDISLSEMRGIIRKNAFQLITNMDGKQIVNGVKGQILNDVRYVEGDVTIKGDISGYETLIVKDGNVIIESDLNVTGNKLGIIVLKDSYDINTDYKVSGNVYVNNNVTKINAAIYADGTLRSAKSNGDSYIDAELLGRLDFNGTLFTRNTIGGATSIGGDYLLPGSQKTLNFDLAQIYDLNYTRKTPICNKDDYALLVSYDARVQTNPPKGFTSN